MSVPISVLVADVDIVKKLLSKSDYFDLLDRGIICEEPLTSNELDFQQLILECFDLFSTKLKSKSRGNLESIFDVLFWSWRGSRGSQVLDEEIVSDSLDLIISYPRCVKLLLCFEDVSWKELNQVFCSNSNLFSFTDFELYLRAWERILNKAVENDDWLFVFVAA